MVIDVDLVAGGGFGLAALLAEAVSAAEGEEGEDYDCDFSDECAVETQVMAGLEKVKAEVEGHEEGVCREEDGDDYVAFHNSCSEITM